MATASNRWLKLLQQMDESLLHMDDAQKEKFFDVLQNAMYDIACTCDPDSSEHMLLLDMAEDARWAAYVLEHRVHGCMGWKTHDWDGNESDLNVEFCKECKQEVLRLRAEQ